MRKKKDYVSLILLLTSLAVFAFAAWKLFGIYAEYHQGAETYEELQDYVQEPKGKDDSSTTDDDGSEKVQKMPETDICRLILKGLRRSTRMLSRGFRFRLWISAIRWYRGRITTITYIICLMDKRIRTGVFL